MEPCRGILCINCTASSRHHWWVQDLTSHEVGGLVPCYNLNMTVTGSEVHDPYIQASPLHYKFTRQNVTDGSSCSLPALTRIARSAFPMLTLAFIYFLFSARSALAAPSVTRPWVSTGYCNAPHVNASHYNPPSGGAQLVHVSVMMRHHKVIVSPRGALSTCQ